MFRRQWNLEDLQQLVLLRGRGIAAAAAVCAVLAVTACSAARPAAMRATRPGAVHNCKVGAWAEKISDVGRVIWQVSLPVDASLKYAGRCPRRSPSAA